MEVKPKKFKMTVTVGKDIESRESTVFYTHALSKESAQARLEKAVKEDSTYKNKYIYCCKVEEM